MRETDARRRWLMAAALATLAPGRSWSETGDPPQHPISIPVPSESIALRSLSGRPVPAVALAVDPTGQRLAVAGDDHRIRMIDRDRWKIDQTLGGHRDRIRTIAFDPTGELMASGGNDGRLSLFRCGRSLSLMQSIEDAPALACLRFCPVGRELAAVGFDNRVFFVGRKQSQSPTLTCDCRDLRAIAYRDDGCLLAVAGRSGHLHLFERARVERATHSLDAFAQDSADSGQHELLQTWVQRRGPRAEVPLHRGRIRALEFHRDESTIICAGEDGMVTCFDSSRDRIRQRIGVATGKLFCLAVLDSQTVAVGGSDNLIRIVDIDAGTVIETLVGHAGSVAAMGVGGGYLFSASFDATVRRWPLDLITRTRQRVAETPSGIDR